MFAVISAGGKQHKISKGDVIEVELVDGSSDTVEFTPLLVVDDNGKSRVAKSDLAGARVTAKVLSEVKGPKIDVFRYRAKTRYRRHVGHRQKYSSIEISDIELGKGRSRRKTASSKRDEVTSDGA